MSTAIKCSIHVDRTIHLGVNIGGRVKTIRFNVVEHQLTQVILRCDDCDRLIKSICPIQLVVELVDVTTVLTIRNPAHRAKDAIPLPKKQEYEPVRHRTRNKISVISRTVLQQKARNWVTVPTQLWHVLTTIDIHEGLYPNKTSICDGQHNSSL